MKRQAIMLILALLIGSAYAAADTTPAPTPTAAQQIEQVPAKFLDQFKRAHDYETAYAEQGKKAAAWIARVDVLNEKNMFGWHKTALRRAFPPLANVGLAPTVGWMEFKAASIQGNPQGWVMELDPRDKKLAGFNHITITADEKDITGVDIK